jgi:hypothetical protein
VYYTYSFVLTCAPRSLRIPVRRADGDGEIMGSRSLAILAALIVIIAVLGIVLWTSPFKSVSGGGAAAEGSGGTTANSHNPIYVDVVSVEHDIDAVVVNASRASMGNETSSAYYYLYYVKEGLRSALLKVRVENHASEVYSLRFILITSTGRQVGPLQEDRGIIQSIVANSSVFNRFGSWDELPYSESYLEGLTACEIKSLAPGATVETYLFYGFYPNEKPVKLHIIAKSVSGHVIELDVPVPWFW